MIRAAVALMILAAPALACAQPVKAADDYSSRFRVNAAPVSTPPAALRALAYASRATPRIEGVSQTSVGTRFSRSGDVAGDAGFLCGLMPNADTAGAAAARGHDPDGRFVGAKLKFAF